MIFESAVDGAPLSRKAVHVCNGGDAAHSRKTSKGVVGGDETALEISPKK